MGYDASRISCVLLWIVFLNVRSEERFVDKVYLLSNPTSFVVNRVKFSLNLIMIRASGYVEYSLRLGDVLA